MGGWLGIDAAPAARATAISSLPPEERDPLEECECREPGWTAEIEHRLAHDLRQIRAREAEGSRGERFRRI